MVFYTILIFGLGLTILFAYKLLKTINTEIQANPDLSSTSKQIMTDTKESYVNLFDGIFLVVVIFLGLVIAIGAYFVYLHPVFFVPSIFIATFIVLIAAVLGNVFHDVSTTSDLNDEREEFSYMKYIMDHIVQFVLVFTFLVIIASYAKFGAGAEP